MGAVPGFGQDRSVPLSGLPLRAFEPVVAGDANFYKAIETNVITRRNCRFRERPGA
jgi:hypothetical protein